MKTQNLVLAVAGGALLWYAWKRNQAARAAVMESAIPQSQAEYIAALASGQNMDDIASQMFSLNYFSPTLPVETGSGIFQLPFNFNYSLAPAGADAAGNPV